MASLILALMLIVTMIVPSAGRLNRPPVALDDQRVILFSPVPVVDIPALDNDQDADGDTLRIAALSTAEGGRAEIVDGTVVRVFPDWSRVNGGALETLVAHGTYLVSDGVAVRQARWTVWYWPVMQP